MRYLRVLCAHTRIAPLGFGGRSFFIKAEKARILTRYNTVNDEFEEVEGTCWHTYIAGVENLATSDGDTCPIGIFLMRFDLADNHIVTNLFSSILRDILKLDDAKGVRAFRSLVLGDF